MKQNKKIGILAYGSLIDDPGEELQPLIIEKIPYITPFKVEYAQLSSSGSNATTLVPVSSGGREVTAIILVLKNDISLDNANSIVWRRETRKPIAAGPYKRPANPGKNAVSLELIRDFHGVDQVIYTSIPQNIGLFKEPDYLAHFAIQSALAEAGETKMDGISYLLDAKKNSRNSNV